MPGHRHRDRDGQEVRGRAHRRRRRRGDQPWRVRRLHPAQPPLLAARAADDVRGEEHRHQPARADRALLDAREGRPGVQVPLHGQGRRLGQQVVPLPGDQGRPQPDAADGVPRREDPLPRHRRLPAVPPRRRHRRHERGVRPQDREVRLGALPRRPADGGLDGRPRHPRRRAGGAGLRAHAVLRDRRAVRRQVLLPRRARRPPPPPRRVVPGRDRRLLLGGPAGARQDHAGGRLPRAARDRPGPLHARRRHGPRHRGRRGRPDRPQPADGRHPRRALEAPGQDPALADRPARRRPRHRARQDQGAPRRRRGDARLPAQPPGLLRRPGQDPRGHAVRIVRPDHGRSHGLLRRAVPGRGRIDGHARQGQPLEGRHRGLPLPRRVLPRLDRRPGRPPRAGLHPVRRGRRVRGARHGGRLEDRGRGLPGLHRRRRQGQRLLHRPLGRGDGAAELDQGAGIRVRSAQ